jgi:hypothetical protein
MLRGYSSIWHEGSVTAYSASAGDPSLNGETLYSVNLGYWEKVGSYFGLTTTLKETLSEWSWSSGLLDEISSTYYAGIIKGKEGKLITLDNSFTNRAYDGSSITVGLLTLGIGTDGLVSAGLGYGGTEVHVGYGMGNGLGQISAGYSHSNNGSIVGSDKSIKFGGGTLIAVAAVYFTGPVAVLAF